MENFNLKAHLAKIYSSFPEAEHQPLIGITCNYVDGDAALRDRYYMQVVAAGGTPVLIPPVADKNVLINTLEHIDGLLFSGGADINPLWAGEDPSPRLRGINAHRDKAELMLARLAYNRQIPMLGICRGMQTMAMAFDAGYSHAYHQTLSRCRPTGTHTWHHHRERQRTVLTLRKSTDIRQ